MASLALLRPSFLHTHHHHHRHYHQTPNLSLRRTLKPTTFSPLTSPPLTKPKRRQNGVVMSASPQPTERIISIAAYTLPLFNSLQYGHYILSQYPKFALLFDPIIPFLAFYRSLPHASFIAFFGLYLGIVRNPSFSQFVRFNSMQALTLDVLLVLPMLFQRIFSPGRSGLGFRLLILSHTVVFVFSVICFLYSVGSCVLGRTPYLPFVADAASRQIGSEI